MNHYPYLYTVICSNRADIGDIFIVITNYISEFFRIIILYMCDRILMERHQRQNLNMIVEMTYGASVDPMARPYRVHKACGNTLEIEEIPKVGIQFK